MIYLVMYDITNNGIRQKLANRLISEGYERIQLSIFAGLDDPRKSVSLWGDIKNWLAKGKMDKLYVLKISKSSFREMSRIGEIGWDPEYLIGAKKSLFI